MNLSDQTASAHISRVVQIVRVVIAGGLLRSTEGLLQATTHRQPRQQAAALAPIRYALSLPHCCQLVPRLFISVLLID